MSKILEIKNIEKTYYTLKDEVKAVDNFSLALEEGEFVGIVGPSGCGKSTILSILSGLEVEDKGSIEAVGNIGYMLQTDALFDWLTILDNCLLGLKIQNKLTSENKQYVLNLLEKYGLKDFINNYPYHLSGGMRQRVLRILYTHK